MPEIELINLYPYIIYDLISKNNTGLQSALNRQKSVYIEGLMGKKSKIPFTYNKLRIKAKDYLSPQAFSYIDGGAGEEETILENKRAFEKWKIRQRMLIDVSKSDLSIELFQNKLNTPILLSPIGVLKEAHKNADIAVASASNRLKVPMIVSNQASYSIEEISKKVTNCPLWFQLYWSKSKDLVLSFVDRAEKSGCQAIVVTLDTTMLGWRPRDLEFAYLPFLQGKGIAQYTSDPVFLKLLDIYKEEKSISKKRISFSLFQSMYQIAKNFPGNTIGNLFSDKPLKAVKQFIDIYSNPGLTWEDLRFLKTNTSLPILLKGIIHPDDAKLAMDHGIDGIVVSNHGGRQVDGAIGALSALPDITNIVNKNIPVLFESGIRSGADIFKALALGADAVCIGRPYVYGLAIKGEQGVVQVIQNLISDFELNMRLAGCTSIQGIKI